MYGKKYGRHVLEGGHNHQREGMVSMFPGIGREPGSDLWMMMKRKKKMS